MIAREEVFKEISRLHDSFLTDHVRKEAIVDYIMRLVGQEAGSKLPYGIEEVGIVEVSEEA